MINIKSDKEIETMRRAGRIAALALKAGSEAIAPGVTTKHIDAVVRRTIEAHGAVPSFLGYRGYPASTNISVNHQVIHGIPGRQKLRQGDIVSIDVGAYFEGFHGDTAATFSVGDISPEAARLIEVTQECFFAGIAQAIAGMRVSDISASIEAKAKENGCGVLRDFTGHGVGRKLHEPPDVPNFVNPGQRGTRLLPGMTIAVEPMVTAGHWAVDVERDGWTVVTKDRSLSAHYEHTILITSGKPELLTSLEDTP